MRRISLLLAGLLVVSVMPVASAAGPDDLLSWALRLGGSEADQPRAVAVDDFGHVYVTGGFSGTVDFDPGAGVAELTSAGSTDVFVAEYDEIGALVWAHRIGSTGSDLGYGIAVGGPGRVYVTGGFTGTVDFDPGVDVFELTSAGSTDAFVVRFDSTGAFEIADRFGSTGFDAGYGIREVSGNAFVTGEFAGTVDFEPGAGTTELTSAGDADVFVIGLDINHDLLWANRFGSTGADVGWGIAVDSGHHVYVAGSFAGTVDFDPGAGTTELTSSGDRDAFVVELDATGGLVWADRFGSTSGDYGLGIDVDGFGHVYVIGVFRETVDFDPGVGVFELTSNGFHDVFAIELDGDGALEWAVGFGSSDGFESGSGIAVDEGGHSHLTGGFSGTVDFDPGAGVFEITSAGADDAFIVELDGDGDLVEAVAVGGTGTEGGSGIGVDPLGHRVVAGWFSATADFDPGSGVSEMTAEGDLDGFVLALDGLSVVTRVSGANRFATAAALSAQEFPSPAATVFVASGRDFPDALAGVPVAAGLNAPMLLVEPNSIPGPTATELARLAPDTIVILGGEAAVSSAVESALDAYATTVTRLAGGDRFGTAVAISQYGWAADGDADVIVIANGYGFADALAGAPAAALLQGPVLLTRVDALPPAVATEISRQDPSTVYVFGGTAVVSDAVITQIQALGPSVIRVSGANRYTTAAGVSGEVFTASERVYIATGLDYPDALVVGAVAGRHGAPLLLVPTDSVPGVVSTEILRLGAIKVIVVGGVNAVSVAVQTALGVLIGA